MEALYSIQNFQDDGVIRTINSPRSLEACLRSGFDPSELIPQPKSHFINKYLTKEMIDIKYDTFENKRKDKIAVVKAERDAIIHFGDRQKYNRNLSTSTETTEVLNRAPFDKVLGMQEIEEKRIKALRARQEKELNNIIEKEDTAARLQKKTYDAEKEELERRKKHDAKVAEQKLVMEKKKQQRLLDLKEKEEEEAHRKRKMERKEADMEHKRRQAELENENRLKREALEKEIEKNLKFEQLRLKTDEKIKEQIEISERNRINMLEREKKIQEQFLDIKEKKHQEIKKKQEDSQKKFIDAIAKNQEIISKKRAEFQERQEKATQRTTETEIKQREMLNKQAEDRESKAKQRLNRLVESYRKREQNRKTIIHERNEKEKVVKKIQHEIHERTEMAKFLADLKRQDKLENVERVRRIAEFERLQTLKKIREVEERYEIIAGHRQEYAKKHLEEARLSITRKHEISEAMHTMRVSNDFSVLDKLNAKREQKDRRTGHLADVEDDLRPTHTA